MKIQTGVGSKQQHAYEMVTITNIEYFMMGFFVL